MAEPLLEIKDLHVEFDVRNGIVRAVDGVSFDLARGATLGIIGESGCGKSVTARAVLHMVPRTAKVRGEVLYHRSAHTNGNGNGAAGAAPIDIMKLDPDGREIRSIRGGEIGMIFQEPMSSLTPVYTAGTHLAEAITLHRLNPLRTLGNAMERNLQARGRVSRAEAREIGIEMLRRVGIPRPDQRIDSYPHQLSGGQRQRVMIAIALSCEPAMLIADEPTTALDVSIEAQILDLMRDLQARMNMAIMFITHNLGVIAEMADEIVVMYLGRQVERGRTVDIFQRPLHPYTQALLKSIPHIGRRTERLAAIEGMVPDPFHLPTGCLFHPRCPQAIAGRCDQAAPGWQSVDGNHWAACFLYER